MTEIRPNQIEGVTASAAEINILDGATLTTTELNYVDGVTSAIQTQIDGKLATGGTATSATVLATPRTIGGVSFDGSANIVPQTIQVVDAAADTTTWVGLFDTATGSLQPKTDATLTFNASTNALSCTTYVGALSGNATTATTATNGTVANEGTDTTCFPLFVTAATGNLPFKSNASLAFNSNTANLSCTTFTGALSGNATTATTATTATNVTVANEATDTTCFPMFGTAATGNLPPKSNANLTFNSSTGALGASSFSGAGTGLTGSATSLTSGITNALASATTTVNVSSATAPTAGQVLTATSGTAATWQTASGGVVVQRVAATPYTTQAALTTTTPLDDTVPLVSEGNQILTANITPADNTNKVLVLASGNVCPYGSAAQIVIALYRGSTCIDSQLIYSGGPIAPVTWTFNYEDSPASSSSQTYSIRVGSSVNVTCNGDASVGRLLGGSQACTMELLELSA